MYKRQRFYKASPEIPTIYFRRTAGRHFRRNRDRSSDHHTRWQNFQDVYKRQLLNGRPLPYYTPPAASDDTPPRTRVLFFTGRKLSQNLVRDFNALAAQAPEKEFWLAYNDFRNTDSAKYLAQLSPDLSLIHI